MKRTLALILAIVMVFALAIPAMATGAGSITVKGNDSINVEKGTFTAYKMLNLKTDSTGEKYAYTVPAALKAFYANYFDLDAEAGSFDVDVYNAIAALDKNDVALRALAKAAKESGKAEATVGAGVSGKNEYKISGLDDGYYLVYDSSNKAVAVSAIMIDTVKQGGNVEINVKADAPKLQKNIVLKDGDSEEGVLAKYASVNLGDEVTYQLDSDVPNMDGYATYSFKIRDVYAQELAVDLESIVVTIGDKTLAADEDYTITKIEDRNAFVLEINDFINYKDCAGQPVKVTYTATVVADIKDIDELNMDGFGNTATLEYSCDPNNPDRVDTSTDTSEVSYTGIMINKIDENTKEALAGAEFEIVGTSTNHIVVGHEIIEKLDPNDPRYNQHTGTTPGNHSEYYLFCNGETYKMLDDVTANDEYNFDERYWISYTLDDVKTSSEVHAKGVTGEDGQLVFVGLGAGTYTITETKAPDGYNKLAEPITVTINYNNETGEYSAEGYTGVYVLINVENSTGTELPSTGGIGTTIFYIVGGLLVVGAAVVLVSKKRMSAEG